MVTFIVNLVGLILIGLIIWWFWLSKRHSSATKVTDKIEIKVHNGIYEPALVETKINTPITLSFFRTDPTPCSEFVIFQSLNISQQLPLNKITNIKLNLKTPGEYEFTCQMGMYRGKLIVKA